MTILIVILSQLTSLLAAAILVERSLASHPSRAHRVLLIALACAMVLPFVSLAVRQMGWGFISPRPMSISDLVSELPPTPVAATERSGDVAYHERDAAPVPLLPPNSAVRPIETDRATPEQVAPTVAASQQVQPVGSPKSAAFAAGTPPLWRQVSWPVALVMAWAACSALAVLRLLVGARAALRIIRRSRVLKCATIESALDVAKRDLHIKSRVGLRVSDLVSCPVIWGWGDANIILPEESVGKDVDWRAVLTHELAHLKRRDQWSALLAEVARCLLPWHPFVAYCCQRLHRLSEVACDAWAVKFGCSPERYAETLLMFAPTPQRLAFSSMATSRSSLRYRLDRLLSEVATAPPVGRPFTGLIILMAILLVPLTALMQTHARPAVAEQQRESAAARASESDESKADAARAKNSLGGAGTDLKRQRTKLTDGEWIQRLTAVPESARWHVGKNMGAELSQLPAGRGYQILASCWERIAVSVRCQILKGYYPEESINSHFFPVMHLGMTSEEAEIRGFASTYLAAAVLRDYEHDLNAYRAWYKTTAGLTGGQVVAREIELSVSKARDPKTRNVREFLKELSQWRRLLLASRTAVRAFLGTEVETLLADWRDAGYVPGDHEAFDIVRQARQSSKSSASAKPPSSPTLEATDEQWIEHLVSIPNEARWYVGAGLGKTMSGMPGDRAYNILRRCWPDIALDVRRQVMKGFTPGFGVHELNQNYFDILGLGIHSAELEVRSTAKVYAESVAFRKFSDTAAFDRWREETKMQTYEQIVARIADDLVAGLDDLDAAAVEARLRPVVGHLSGNAHMKRALDDAGLPAILEGLLKEGKIAVTSRWAGALLKKSAISPDVMQAALAAELDKLVAAWEEYAASKNQGEAGAGLRNLATSIGGAKYAAAIPTMIGIIDADNSYTTIYGVGYFGLRPLTGVHHSAMHDGAWWRRWWEKNKKKFPPAVRELDIPLLTKSIRGRRYVPFPESMETLAGKLAWMLQRQKAGLDFEVALETIEEEHQDPKAIPVLIGVLDADNSQQMISQVGRCLKSITGVEYTQLSDGPWWRRWWDENKARYSAEVQAIPIPDLPKTEHGKNYVSISVGLDTLDDKIAFLKENSDDEAAVQRVWGTIQDECSAGDIPKLIGIIDADNSYDTVYGIGYFCLSEVTDVDYSPLHDGAWWRRWWDKNKETYPEVVRRTPIPDLPKTEHGRRYKPFPAGLDSIDGKIAFLNTLEPADSQATEAVFRALSYQIDEAKTNGDSDIPKLIGIIESDNSESTVYGVGGFILREMTGVQYLPHHDGAWWRRWWQRNKVKFSPEARKTPIPEVKKTAYGKRYLPYPETLDTLDGTIAWVEQGCPSFASLETSHIVGALCEHGDPRAIPIVIGWVLAEGSSGAIRYYDEVFARLTGVEVTRTQTPQWWKKWWEDNQAEFPLNARSTPIPDLTQAFAKYLSRRKARQAAAREQEFLGLPSAERAVDADNKKTYFQIGPPVDEQTPQGGWKVLVILPGGDGSDDFNTFCRRIHKYALPDDYIVMQLVAPVWSDDDNRVVWPTEKLNPQHGPFTTEQFIREAVEDLGNQLAINDMYVFALGWSSGGPAVYANSVVTDSPVKGSFVAMSVFHPAQMNELAKANGHPYFILHSPDDWISIDDHATQAVRRLSEAGATTRLQLYDGGHGWRDDPFGNIRRGVDWLQTQIK